MTSKLKHGPPVSLITVSFAGLIITILIHAYSPVQVAEAWQKPLAGSLFMIICSLGVLAAIYPKKCSRPISRRQRETPQIIKQTSNQLNGPLREKAASSIIGHHPDCNNFSGHIIKSEVQTFCAACTGLLIGAVLSFFGTTLYFFSNFQLGGYAPTAVYLGGLTVSLGFLQFILFDPRGLFRMSFNITFVLGVFLILAGVNEKVHSLTVDFFILALTVLWITTRISLSNWKHRKICLRCSLFDICGFQQ